MGVRVNWCGLRVEGTAGTKAQRYDAIKCVCGASGEARNKTEELIEALGTKIRRPNRVFSRGRKKEKEGEER